VRRPFVRTTARLFRPLAFPLTSFARHERCSVVSVVDRLDVLVVEDDAPGRNALRLAVHALGHHCRAAGSTEEALRMYLERRPDVVISDCQLTGTTGADVCSRIRQMAGGAHPYFLLLGALHDRSHLVAGIAAGADDWQQTPVDLDELESRLVTAARVIASRP
jgi:DNA-binding response OmpR family regulator